MLRSSVASLLFWAVLGSTALAATDIDKNPTAADFYARYKTSPVILGDGWGNVPSLWLRSDSFTRSQIVGDIISTVPDPSKGYSELFFGTYGDLFGDGSLALVLSSWSASNPPNQDGSLHVLQLNDSGIAKADWIRVEGSSSPWIGDFAKTGKPQILLPGFRDAPVIPTQSYLVTLDRQASKFTKLPIGIPTTSHTSFLGSWDNGGAPSILGTSFGVNGFNGKPFDVRDNQPVLYQADGLGGVKQSFLGNRHMIHSASVAFADFNNDGRQDLVTADTSFQQEDGQWIKDIATYIHLATSADGYHQHVLLPAPYFQSSKYDGIDSLMVGTPPVTAAQARTHKIALRIVDVNGDGRPDVIVSSMVWSNYTPYRVLQLLIQQPDQTFRDETDVRLFNYDLRGMGAHLLYFEDINGDGFPDLILRDDSYGDGNAVNSCASQGNEVLINDGEGHFISVMKDSYCKFASDPANVRAFNPWFNKVTRKLGFVETTWQWWFAGGMYRYLYTQAVAKTGLSSGPNFIDPATRGEPGFNEWYYLLHYPDAKAAVDSEKFANGLEYYLAVGKVRGDKTHVDGALNASNKPEDCLMNWAETTLPGLFAPPTTSKVLPPYYYRYYWGTNAYLGMSSSDGHVYYLNKSGALTDVGAQKNFVATAGCQ